MSATLHRTEGEREAFEAWFLKGGTAPSALERDDLGYVVSVTAACWEAWQDRAALSGWQPIETAPKNGTRVLAWSNSYGARETYWSLYGDGSIAKQEFLAGNGPSGAWEWSEPQSGWLASWRPTFWMPLPPAPNQGEAS